METSVLRVHHYHEDLKEERRVTLSPVNITVVAAHTEDIEIRGLSLREVAVLFLDGGSLDLTVNHSDLKLLEEAVGSYTMEFERD